MDKFIGLSNKLEPLSIKDGLLKTATNVDIDDVNDIRRRDGYILSQGSMNITSSYCKKDRTESYIINGGALTKVSDLSVLDTGYGTGTYYWDDSGSNICIYGDRKSLVRGSKAVTLSIPMCPAPDLALTNGNLPEGLYQVTAVYRDAGGREGGCTVPTVIKITTTGGIEVKVAQIADYTVTIYVSPPNGKILYQWLNTTSISSVWSGPLDKLVYPLDARHIGAYPIPDNCSALAFHQSRLYLSEYISKDDMSIVWFSLPFSYHLYDKSKSYISIEGRINALVDVNNALVIATDNAIYYYADGQIRKVADYGVPQGKTYAKNNKGQIWMYTNEGICLLNEFSNITDELFSFPISSEVNASIIERNGFESMINLLADKNPAKNTFRS